MGLFSDDKEVAAYPPETVFFRQPDMLVHVAVKPLMICRLCRCVKIVAAVVPDLRPVGAHRQIEGARPPNSYVPKVTFQPKMVRTNAIHWTIGHLTRPSTGANFSILSQLISVTRILQFKKRTGLISRRRVISSLKKLAEPAGFPVDKNVHHDKSHPGRLSQRHTVPQIQGCPEGHRFLQTAFGAQEQYAMPGPDGKGVMHTELRSTTRSSRCGTKTRSAM
jgi:hypothetical protein